MLLLSITSFLIAVGIMSAIWISIYILLQVVLLPIKLIFNYVTFNRLQPGKYVYTEREWSVVHGGYIPVSSAKVINVIRNDRGRISYVELDDGQKMTFKEYNKLSQF